MMSEYSVTLNKIYHGALLLEGIFGAHIHGAQMIVADRRGVLLVRTRYRPFWEFPGGRVERYEAPESAAIRETKEEARIFVKELDRKLGAYTYQFLRRRVTIHVFIAKEWEELDLWRPTMEIAAREFFPLNNLPHDISPATAKRLAEYHTMPPKEYSGTWM